MLPALELFRSYRVQRVVDELQDVREAQGNLWFLGRTPVNRAMESEVIGRWQFRAQIADIIAPDSEARIYQHGQMSLYTHKIPKIKIGVGLSEQQIRDILNFGNFAADGQVPDFILTSRARMAAVLVLGIRQRWEQMIIAAYLDTFHYDRMGMKIDATWGTPADLKVVLEVPWTDDADATPVDDVWAVLELGRIRYGKDWNQMVISTEGFRNMIRTAEFQAKAALFLPQTITYNNLVLANLPRQRELATNILGLEEIVFHDERYWYEDAQGLKYSDRFWPINYALLRSTADDNNSAACDVANTWTTESVLDAGVQYNGTEGWTGFGAGRYGPHVYTHIPPHLDPPSVQAYGVANSWPRKERTTAAWLKIAPSLVDSIPVGEPFA